MCARVRAAQDSETVVGINRAVGLSGSDQDHSGVTGLNRDSSNRERWLIVNQRLPRHLRYVARHRVC